MSEQIKALRDRSGKSRSQVAADLDISERTLYRLETQTGPLARRWCLVFSAYYGVDVAEIEGCDAEGVKA